MAAVPEATLNTGGTDSGALGALKPQLGNQRLLVAGIAAVVAVMVVVLLWNLVGRPEATETAVLRRVAPLWRRLTGAPG